MILCVDPGINACGCALFSGERLHRAWLARSQASITNPPLARVVAMAQAVVRNLAIEEMRALQTFVGEWPVVYPPKRGRAKRVDPNVSLVPLAGVIAAIAAQLPPTVTLTRYLPREWKGTLDGDAFTSRIIGRLSLLEMTKVEACAESLRHNVFDAVGLGLFRLGRLVRKRYISRGAPANEAL